MDLFNRTSRNGVWTSRNTSASLQEIDLRKEFHDLLFGNSYMPQRGHWVVYRRFNLNSVQDGYDEVYKVGPSINDLEKTEPRKPFYNYTDELVMTRQDPLLNPILAESQMPAGILKSGQYIFYFEYDFKPTENDQIFDIDWDDMRIKPPDSILNGKYLKKYNIKEVFPYRADGGLTQYWICYVNWDLVNP